MSDEQIRQLEREVLAGDESARVVLTFRRIRAKAGLLLAWEGSTEGAPVFWVYRGPERRRRRMHGLAVLGLEDALDLAFRIQPGNGERWGRIPPGAGFSMIDLSNGRELGGCYPRSTAIAEVSTEPPPRSPVRR